MNKKIKAVKKAVKEGKAKTDANIDKDLIPTLLDEKTEFTYLGSHAVFEGKEGEYIFSVASVRNDGYDKRTWGWVATEKEAREAVAGNSGDLNEANYYPYAVVEKLGSGICCIDIELVAWFKWINNPENKYEGKWAECPEPKWAEGTIGWTL